MYQGIIINPILNNKQNGNENRVKDLFKYKNVEIIWENSIHLKYKIIIKYETNHAKLSQTTTICRIMVL